jgi:hypothetical protein
MRRPLLGRGSVGCRCRACSLPCSCGGRDSSRPIKMMSSWYLKLAADRPVQRTGSSFVVELVGVPLAILFRARRADHDVETGTRFQLLEIDRWKTGTYPLPACRAPGSHERAPRPKLPPGRRLGYIVIETLVAHDDIRSLDLDRSLVQDPPGRFPAALAAPCHNDSTRLNHAIVSKKSIA